KQSVKISVDKSEHDVLLSSSPVIKNNENLISQNSSTMTFVCRSDMSDWICDRWEKCVCERWSVPRLWLGSAGISTIGAVRSGWRGATPPELTILNIEHGACVGWTIYTCDRIAGPGRQVEEVHHRRLGNL